MGLIVFDKYFLSWAIKTPEGSFIFVAIIVSTDDQMLDVEVSIKKFKLVQSTFLEQ